MRNMLLMQHVGYNLSSESFVQIVEFFFLHLQSAEIRVFKDQHERKYKYGYEIVWI